MCHTRHCTPITSSQHLHVFCDILSPRVVFGVLCCFFRSSCFLLVTIYGTTHTLLVLMCWPLLWGLHQMGHTFAIAQSPPPNKLVSLSKQALNCCQTSLMLHCSSSSARPTHSVPVMQTEHVQQFTVCYSRTRKFYTVLWTARKSPNKIGTTSTTFVLHQCQSTFTRVQFACIIGGYHTLP